MTLLSGKLGQDNWDRATLEVQLGQDIRERTSGIGQSGQRGLDGRTTSTRKAVEPNWDRKT
jgi:hypothetical protein